VSINIYPNFISFTCGNKKQDTTQSSTKCIWRHSPNWGIAMQCKTTQQWERINHWICANLDNSQTHFAEQKTVCCVVPFLWSSRTGKTNLWW
jgi:hypothetical protein